MAVTMTLRRAADGEREVVILNDGRDVGSILLKDFLDLAVVKMARTTPTEGMQRSMADTEAGVMPLSFPRFSPLT